MHLIAERKRAVVVRLIARVDALSGFLASDDGENLVAAYKRASNIVAMPPITPRSSFV